MGNNILEAFNKVSRKTPAASKRQAFRTTFKNVVENKALLAKIRNALLIYLLLMVVFRVFSFIAGVYLPEQSYASFVAYFSFFILVAGGLFFSIYFPVKYSGAKASFNIKTPNIKLKAPKVSIKTPKIRFPDIKFPSITLPSIKIKKAERKVTKSEKELNSLLKQERKNYMKVSKEKESVSKKYEKMAEKCKELEKDKKELHAKSKELGKAVKPEKKMDFSSIMDKLLPAKKEVVIKNREVKREMPKIKLSGQNKKLSQKYRKLPKQGQQRVELFRNIARNVQKETNSFSIAQIMEVLVELFPTEINDDRREALKEIEEWVKEDPYTPLIKTEKGVSYHRIIK